MIATCPSCATRAAVPSGISSPEGTVLRCRSCGHSWLEARQPEIVDVSPVPVSDHARDQQLSADDPEARELEREARRIAEASKRAREQRELKMAARRASIRRWSAFAAAVSIPVLAAIVFPDFVVRHAPGAMKLYQAAGLEVNVRGFEIRNVRQQYLVTDGQRVLALRGEVVNVRSSAAKVPAIRFTLRDKASKPVYAWTLNGVTTRALKPMESTSFVTRVASPPKTADDVQIRFARAKEIGVNANP